VSEKSPVLAEDYVEIHIIFVMPSPVLFRVWARTIRLHSTATTSGRH